MNDAEKTIQRDPENSLDLVLRAELHWDAPPDLTNRLLALASGTPTLNSSAGAVVAASLPAPLRPQRWYAWLVMLLTAAAIGLSFAVAWQFYSAVGAELGLGAMWIQFQAALMNGIQQLYQTVPATRYLIALLVGIRDQLHWLLLAAVLWLALDGWSPNFSSRRQHQTS